MRVRFLIALGIMLLVMGIGFEICPFSVLNGSAKHGEPECSASIYAIPRCDLFHSISNAVYNGDADQAIRLYRHYKFSDESKSDELFWLYVAMMLGHERGIKLYTAKVDRGDINESSFWDTISRNPLVFRVGDWRTISSVSPPQPRRYLRLCGGRLVYNL